LHYAKFKDKEIEGIYLMENVRILQLAKAYVTSIIGKSFITENIGSMLECASPKISFEDFETFGWNYLIVDEIHSSYPTIKVLNTCYDLTAAEIAFEQCDDDANAIASFKRPEPPRKNSKYYEEPKTLRAFILKESILHTWLASPS
jgi:hypothetical protein